MSVLWRQFKQFSGCLVRGTDPVVPQDATKHMSCAAWLTSEAEAPSYGYVQSYDGAGISAGLLHNILVMPATMTQGDLGLLVRRLLDAVDLRNPGYDPHALVTELQTKGWTISPDGKFRMHDGHLVSGADLRNWVAPPNGHVPQSGPDWEHASKIAMIFHDLFSYLPGRKVQEDFAIAWLAAGNRTAELNVYHTFGGLPQLDSPIGLPVASLPPAVHVAMCVYHSFSVNSPNIAAQCLARAVQIGGNGSSPDPRTAFAKALIRELGLHGRAAWHDLPGDGNDRYDRTRLALWSRADLFPGGMDLMPRDLV